jgi:ABC-2 type transport system permease protein
MYYQELLWELIKREIKARYKQSLLGYAWVILVPLLNLLVLTVVFSYLIRVPTGGTPYPIFLFVALVPWTFTANSISFATQSVVSNTNLITKIYLPREVFPIATILAKMVDFLLTCLVLLLFLVIFGVSFKATMLFVPVIFFFHLLLILGISFILSAMNVFFRDVENVIGIFLTIWMYITPVLYPQELVPPAFVPFLNLNPMMPIINAYRNTILYGMMPAWQSFAYAVGFSTFIFIFGYKFFKNRAKYFADVI